MSQPTQKVKVFVPTKAASQSLPIGTEFPEYVQALHDGVVFARYSDLLGDMHGTFTEFLYSLVSGADHVGR